jgi:hypothetical protein
MHQYVKRSNLDTVTNGESSNKTIFTVAKEKEILDKAIEIVKSF